MEKQSKSVGRLTRIALAGGAVVLGMSFSQAASAQDRGVAWAGVDFSHRTIWGYAGTAVAVGHSLADSGFNVRFAGFAGDFDYNAGRRTVDATGGGVELGVGYQWIIIDRRTHLTGYVSGVYRSFDTSPNDPNSDLSDEHWGLKLQLEFEHRFSQEWGIETIGAYTFNFDSYWTRVRPSYWITNSIRVGPELSFYGGDEYDRQRVGFYIEGIPLFTDRFQVGAKAGWQNDSRRDFSSAYAGVSASFRF